MKTEAEIRARIEGLKEEMKGIKNKAREETFGTPNYQNSMIYGSLMRNSMMCYHDVAMLLWVLDEPLTYEIDLLTRLNPADEKRIRKIIEKKTSDLGERIG